jgi:hypothetical protein
MEALVILANFLAMAFVLIWCANADRKGDQERRKGLLGFGDKPGERAEKPKPKYWRD